MTKIKQAMEVAGEGKLPCKGADSLPNLAPEPGLKFTHCTDRNTADTMHDPLHFKFAFYSGFKTFAR